MRKYRNTAEEEFAVLARSMGWEVTKRGYPDFICYQGNRMILVEVKKKSSHRLKKSQKKFMDYLSAHGVKCYKWSPDRNWLEKVVQNSRPY